jgi:triacylglycerol lipase
MKKECVLLIHGLAESEWRMLPMSLWLSYAGYRVIGVTYPSTFYPAEQLAEEYIAPLLRDLESEETLNVVTHSLGSILLRYCLKSKRQKNLKRVVMTTPAHHGSEQLEIYRHNPFMSALLGPSLQQSGIGEHCFACKLEDRVDYEVGIIAGSMPIDPISYFTIPWPHDGRESVARTKLQGMKDHITILASHDFVTFHPLAVYQTYFFLKQGYFHRFKSVNYMEDYMLKDNNDENAKNNKWQVKPEYYPIQPTNTPNKPVVVTPPKKDPYSPTEIKKKQGKYPLHDEEIGGA